MFIELTNAVSGSKILFETTDLIVRAPHIASQRVVVSCSSFEDGYEVKETYDEIKGLLEISNNIIAIKKNKTNV